MKNYSKNDKFAFIQSKKELRYGTHGVAAEFIGKDTSLKVAVLSANTLMEEKVQNKAEAFQEMIEQLCENGRQHNSYDSEEHNPFLSHFYAGMRVQYNKTMRQDPRYTVYNVNLNLGFRNILYGGLKQLSIKQDKKIDPSFYTFEDYGQFRPQDDQEAKNIVTMCELSEKMNQSFALQKMYKSQLERTGFKNTLGNFVSFYSNTVLKSKVREFAHEKEIPLIQVVSTNAEMNLKKYVSSDHIFSNGERALSYPCTDVMTSPASLFNNLTLLHYRNSPQSKPLMDMEETRKVAEYFSYMQQHYRY